MNGNLDPAAFLEQFKLFVGFDWANDEHDLAVLDPSGKFIVDLTFQDTAEGWAVLRSKFVELAGPDLSKVAVAVETCNGPAVERLLAMRCRIYPLNPKAAKRYRERKVVSGAKSDRMDAWSFADALRTDGHGWKELIPDDPLTQELRILCRDEVCLIGQRTALVLQLTAALREYYPAALEAFETWTCPGTWAFVQKFPTPKALVAAGKRRWEKFLHTNRLCHKQTYQYGLDVFAKADQFAGPEPVANAKSRLALTLVAQLSVLEKQLQQYRKAIEDLFGRHPDRDIFGSLPGAGNKTAPRLLSEIGSIRRRFKDAQALQSYAGTAPVTMQSGKSRHVRFRRACNKYLRSAVNFLADNSRGQCAWAQAYYQHKMEQGMTRSCALRNLGQRWLKILWKMWQTNTSYNEALHAQNQVKHGSWIIQPG
ncbi:MAG: IS110 family transposase [Planctomycetes bacterium]|nr:IS110 family transposase [Planctomycetota bacterium]